jgi:hypothetical protein
VVVVEGRLHSGSGGDDGYVGGGGGGGGGGVALFVFVGGRLVTSARRMARLTGWGVGGLSTVCGLSAHASPLVTG